LTWSESSSFYILTFLIPSPLAFSGDTIALFIHLISGIF
jgi:hypothetical protein